MGQQEMEDWATSHFGQATFLCSQIWFTLKIRTIFQGCAENLALRSYRPQAKEDSDEEANDQPPPVEAAPAKEADDDQYEEEVLRQIAKDELNQPERAELEKCLRLKRRFRVNKSSPPGEQMGRLQQEIADTIMLFTSMVRKRLKRHVRLSIVALLSGYVHFRDILHQLLKEKVQKEEEFLWQM